MELRTDCLSANRLFLIDCLVTATEVKAGWMWCDKYLNSSNLLLTSNTGKFKVVVVIPPSLRNSKNSMTLSFPDDTVDFEIA